MVLEWQMFMRVVPVPGRGRARRLFGRAEPGPTAGAPVGAGLAVPDGAGAAFRQSVIRHCFIK